MERTPAHNPNKQTNEEQAHSAHLPEFIFRNGLGDLLLHLPLKLMVVEVIMIAGAVVRKDNTTKDTFMMLNHFIA